MKYLSQKLQDDSEKEGSFNPDWMMTWYRRHENNYHIASIDEKESYFNQNHIIILPPDLKIPFGITHYVTELN